MSKKIWQIFWIAGNAEMFRKVHKSGMLSKSEAQQRWESMNRYNGATWRMWLERGGKRIEESERETKWRQEEKD